MCLERANMALSASTTGSGIDLQRKKSIIHKQQTFKAGETLSTRVYSWSREDGQKSRRASPDLAESACGLLGMWQAVQLKGGKPGLSWERSWQMEGSYKI